MNQRGISLFSAVNLVVASMIGAGVYTTSGFSLGGLETPGRVIAAWIVAGVIAICGAISYGSLAGRFRESGGEYLFLSRVLHPAAGYVAGAVSVIAGFTGATAIAAVAFESYLPSFSTFAGLRPGTMASIVIIVAALMHGVQSRLGPPVQNALVVAKFIMLAAFFAVAIASYPEKWATADSPAVTPAAFSWVSFAVALMWISLSYSGFNAAIYVAGEVRDPAINVPRSLWIATLLVMAIYVGLNIVFVFAPQRELIVNQEQIAVIAARTIGGVRFESFIRVVILVSLATSVSAMMMSGPRVYAKMADDGVLPRWFSFQKKAPTFAVAVQALTAILIVQISTLQRLLGYLGFTLSVTAAIAVSTIFVMRARGERIEVPFYPVPPLVFVAATLVIATVAGVQQPASAVTGLLTMATGLLLYACRRRAPLPQ